MANTGITLSTLNLQIKNATEQAFPRPVWVIAEVLEMNINRSGHCYMELIEKSEADNKIIAKSRATIWAFRYKSIRPYFETTSGTQLKSGMKLLLQVEVSFHELYGASLNIRDIDPAFTMGDLALKRKEVIKKLEDAGIIDMNKELELIDIPQNLAVISSETAAGYGDFCDSLLNNSFGFYFNITLFPAIVQGDTAEDSIIAALEKINENEELYDAVILIRGGGSQADLQCFNQYDLAMNIAQFPLPVITGIGHERDETIADIVAFMSLKTPTAVAEYLIDTYLEFSENLRNIQNRFEQAVRWIIQEKSVALKEKAGDLQHLIQQYLQSENQILKEMHTLLGVNIHKSLRHDKEILNNQTSKLRYLWKGLFEHKSRDLQNSEEKFYRITAEKMANEKDRINALEKNLELLKPEKVLARGYSISYQNGQIVKSVNNIDPNNTLTTKLSDGEIISTILK